MDARPDLAAWTPPFAPGDPAPWFTLPSPATDNFHFSTTVGHYLLLGFLPPPGSARDAAIAAFQSRRRLFDDNKLTAFLVVHDAASIASVRNQLPGLRWFLDAEGQVSRLYGALDADGTEHPFWLLLDPSHRVLWAGAAEQADALTAELDRLPPLDDYAGVALYAPVLIIPRVIEPNICRELIALYDAQGGTPSGVMRDVDGRTVGVLDDFKKRRDVFIEDRDLRDRLLGRIARRIAPEIEKAYQFKTTRLERYLVARYDAEEGGYFRPHRDNETFGTRHRKFAVSINLNAEDFEGGDLRFPEFGTRTYRPPTGGAVVFACGLQHEATPVTRGRRYAFLPFLYDEAGQVVREANTGKLDISPG
ncbi:2OG-Fe(II) oxygenase family protein [Phenylobacterium sp.]|uniref:2OG-Fe(II) oxygenase family protein n=1 Tax=Phenylobacterium sp. TaxID=1871053 RepID=UPI002F40CA44